MKRATLISIAVCAAAAFGHAASASGSVTIGSNLASTPALYGCGWSSASDVIGFSCTTAGSSYDAGHAASGGAQSPISGVVVRWRLKHAVAAASMTAQSVRPRILPINPSTTPTAYTDIPLSVAGTLEVATRFPIKAGERLGLDSLMSGVAGGGGTTFFASSGGTFDLWSGLPPANAPVPDNTGAAGEMLFNADVEPDLDGDGYGDETQDQCPTDASTTGPCPDHKAPAQSASIASHQNFIKQGGILVNVKSSENGIAHATGTVRVAGVSKAFTLKRAAASLTAGKRLRLLLKFSSKAATAIKQALGAGKKVKFAVSVYSSDLAGNKSAKKKLHSSAK